MKEFFIQSEAEIPRAARWFVDEMKNARVFAFRGELGAGKTTLIKAICQLLNVRETVSSPSFALVNEYTSKSGGIIYHMDLYRIREKEELFDIGFEDYIFSDHLCFIEWPEIGAELLPPESMNVKIEINPDHSRKISLNT